LAGFLVTFLSQLEEDFFVASLSGCSFIKTIFAGSVEGSTQGDGSHGLKCSKMPYF